MTTKTIQRKTATPADLARIDEKAELIHGEIRRMAPTGGLPNYASGEIFASLRDYARRMGTGHAVADNAGFLVNLPHRRSFSPDAGFWMGELRMGFFDGAPVFAAEVRSENDYGPQAERDMAAKRADYFAAGTRVVWDVDLLNVDVVKSYRFDVPDLPTVFRRGEIADAEPTLPGWRLPVSDLIF